MSSRQETIHAQVFVQIVPMNNRAIADDFKVVAFRWRAVPQSRIPHQRHDNRASIHQVNDERIFVDGNLLRVERFPLIQAWTRLTF